MTKLWFYFFLPSPQSIRILESTKKNISLKYYDGNLKDINKYKLWTPHQGGDYKRRHKCCNIYSKCPYI